MDVIHTYCMWYSYINIYIFCPLDGDTTLQITPCSGIHEHFFCFCEHSEETVAAFFSFTNQAHITPVGPDVGTSDLLVLSQLLSPLGHGF